MKRILMSLGFLLLTAPLSAQTLPTGVAFDVNLSQHSSSTVSGYKIYIVIGTNTIRVSDIGKPAPSGSTIVHMNSALFTGLTAGSYTVHSTAYGPGGESGASNKASFSISTSGSTAPSAPTNTTPIYEGSAGQNSPVIVQAEHFDSGGAGVGFNDLTSSNEGGALRSGGVDIEATSDKGGGHNVGWISAGEWLDYTVNIPFSGTYELQFRVASQGQGGTFHVEVDGRDVTGPLRIPATGGWQTWTTLRKGSVTLQAGSQVWRVVMDSPGSNWRDLVGNINWIMAIPQ